VARPPADIRRRVRAVGRARRPTPAGPAGRRAIASSLAVAGAAQRGRVCVGAVLGAHGIGGAVRIKSFTAKPADLAAYGPVSDEAGARSFALAIEGVRPDCVIARIEGIGDRNTAAALRGTRLYVARDRLPEPERDEFYHADLLGMAVETASGDPFGTVVAVHAAGAIDTLEIERGRGLASAMVPFTRAAVPEVDVAARRIVVAPDAGLIDSSAEELVERP
jgi:16S rRNA processing protein RimM